MSKEKTILVTGGAGYIGSMAVKVLKEQGYRPVIFDNLVYGHQEFIGSTPFYEGDLASCEDLREVFQSETIDAVMHFAAYAYVGESVEDPRKYYQNNAVGAMNLLNVMLESNVKYFIFSSTCATFGNPEKVPMSEDHIQNPVNPYGFTKFIIERMLQDYEKAYGMKSCILRYFNAAGADPEGEVGEDHNPETHLIPLILDVAVGRKEAIQIYGTDYPTPDGTCIRDYIHVHDLAMAHVLALEKLQKENKSEHFNLGNGKGFSVREVIQVAEEVIGKKIPIKETERRPGDPAELVSDSQKAFQVLGWKPQYNDLRAIIETAWKFHQRRFKDQDLKSQV